MIKFFYKIEKELMHIRFRYLRNILILLNCFATNIYAFIYYNTTRIKSDENNKVCNFVNNEVILTLTSYPKRMQKLPFVLESIFRQTIKPNRVLLWLADEQYSDKEKVSRFLKKYIKQGLEIRYCDDLKSHKKYYYSIKNNPNSLVITIDDDIIYPENLIERLLNCYSENPDCIIANRAHKMTYDAGNKLKPYSMWEMLAPGERGPSLDLFATTGGGCLFPPNILPMEAFDKEVITKCCMYADDVWIKCLSYYKGVKVVLTEKDNPEIIEVMSFKSEGLAKLNVVSNKNDQQLAAVSDYFGIKWIPEL